MVNALKSFAQFVGALFVLLFVAALFAGRTDASVKGKGPNHDPRCNDDTCTLCFAPTGKYTEYYKPIWER